MHFFNTAGPINPDLHYYIPPLSRFDLDEILALIEQQKYFVIHAPRKVGKTSYLLALMDYLNQTDAYRCLYVNIEVAQTAREDVQRGMRAILSELCSMARDYLGDSFLADIWSEILENSGGDAALSESLTRWAQVSDKPLVLLIDEIDALMGDTLISVLRQLRTGYAKRPTRFPHSIVLCGVRDVRDYQIHSSREQAIVTGGSAFNIKSESLRMDDFNRQEVERLYQQHTDETAQPFDGGVVDAVWEYSHGQPWLVNALGYEVCFRMTLSRDRTLPITVEMIQEAKERLLLRRETHLDQLVEKLKEDRVRQVINPMLQGADLDTTVRHDDVQYVTDLGLIRHSETGLRIANKIYSEIIPRELTTIFQLNFESMFDPALYMVPNGALDMSNLLSGFQQFFCKHSESWLKRFDYQEAGPHLMLQAFLQHIVNRGGFMDREYGLSRRRTDLLITWPCEDGVQRIVIETKLRRDAFLHTMQQGLEQTREYMDRCGADEGHLVIFGQDTSKPWEEKVFMRNETYQGKTIRVWGM